MYCFSICYSKLLVKCPNHREKWIANMIYFILH